MINSKQTSKYNGFEFKPWRYSKRRPTEVQYKNYSITFVRPPIPASCGMDYSFQHEDFDVDDNRCGSGPTVEDCKEQIDEQIAEGNTF